MRSGSFYSWLLILIILPASIILITWIVKYYARLAADRLPAIKGDFTVMKSKDESNLFLATFQDIVTRLKEKEKELKHDHQVEKERANKTELFSEKIISSIESALITIDKAGKITTFNAAAERLLKISALVVKDASYKGLFSSSPQMISLIEQCLNQGSSFNRQEIRVINESGEALYLGAAISPIKENEDTPSGALCLITDLTEITELQKRVKLKENLAALGEMSAGIAHEFKNSLATILGHAQMVLHESEDPSTKENSIAIIEETRSLLQVVASFLDFAKPSTLNIAEFQLEDLIKDCIKGIEPDTKFPAVQVSISGSFPRLKGDKVLLRQALMNLMINAFEAIAAEATEKKVWIRGKYDMNSSPKQAILEIEDTGTGIAEMDLEKIFLPFFTTKRQGTGLGLAIALKIIVLHNGKIITRRRGGHGMIFTVSLPV